jgi:hypothetical protein
MSGVRSCARDGGDGPTRFGDNLVKVGRRYLRGASLCQVIVSKEKKKCYFLKKRTKKLLSVWFRASLREYASGDEGGGEKVFCFFFSKKKSFFFLQQWT